jgi:aminopeptidase N
LGEYPYDYVTAVESALSAGSGMEYPMITVIGDEANDFELDLVITHEVGHNWFYGILGSNERMHAWMDEGLNSFYETRYVLKKYPKQELGGYYEKLRERAQMEKTMYQNGHQIRSLVLDQMQPIESMATPLDALPSSFFYYVYHYDKPAALFFHLLAYLGEEKLDKAMRTYYAQWQFKHPYPKDLRAVLEAETGKNLAWLFEDLIEKNKKIDVEISSCVVEGETIKIKLSNKGEAQVPLPLQFLDKNKNVLFSIWIEPFSGEKTIEKQLNGVVSAVLDFEEVTLDLVKKDNHCK